MKVFQIEEPDGSPSDPDAPGAAIGIDASGKLAEVAFAIGGNAVILGDREGFECDLPVPPLRAAADEWQALLEGARIRAERSLGRPVTHAVLVLARQPGASTSARIIGAAGTSGLELLAVLSSHRVAATGAERPALAAAILAEDGAPRPPEL